MLMFALGAVITITQLPGLITTNTWSEFQTMHVFFGLLICVLGALGYVTRRLMHNYASPVVMAMVGVMMLLHHQDNAYAGFLHKGFGFSCIATGISRACMTHHQQAVFFTAVSGLTSAALFGGSSEGSVQYFMTTAKMAPINTIFLLLLLVVSYTLVATLVILYLPALRQLRDRRGIQEIEMGERCHLNDSMDDSTMDTGVNSHSHAQPHTRGSRGSNGYAPVGHERFTLEASEDEV
eukprot:GFYU01010990.1.p1 GENE.GFYU01010990.1~~GFYU01010990.1.p1  ORF type:complete len:237 (-),score=47.77 GFYU01010990.1:32-742(-)